MDTGDGRGGKQQCSTRDASTAAATAAPLQAAATESMNHNAGSSQNACEQQDQEQALREAETLPPVRRGRGRPPKVGATYSRKYMNTRSWRAKKKSEMEDLASEVTEKIKRLELLAAENEALQGHERLLKQTIAARDGVLQLLSGHQPQQQAQAPKRVKQQNAEAAPQHYGAHISNEAADSPVAAAGCADPSSCSASSSANSAGGASSSGSGNGALGGGAQASGDDSMPFCFQEMTAEEQAKVDAFFRRYKEHMEHALKERLQPDGVVLPLPAGDARRERFLEMLQDACTWPVHTMVRFSVIRLDTMENEERPPDFYSRVAKGMRVTPEQEAAMLSMYNTQAPAIRALEKEINALQAALSTAGQQGELEVADAGLVAADEGQMRSMLSGGGSGDVSGALASEKNLALATQLWSNIRKEYELWTHCNGYITSIIGEQGFTQWALQAWPHIVDAFGTLSAYRKERLGLDD